MSSSKTTTTLSSNINDMLIIKELKRKLRKEMTIRVGRLTKEECDRQSQLISNKLFQMKEFQKSKRVGLYLNMEEKNEVDTTKFILKRCFQDNKLSFIPSYTPSNTSMKMLQLYSLEDFKQLPLEPKWKIKQPEWNDNTRSDALLTGGLDLILVPGVAFTKQGLRLGHGKGYYDRWLTNCLNQSKIDNNFTKMPYTIGLAFREQILEDLPVNEFDFKIDQVIYPD